MLSATITAIATHLPSKVLNNEQLSERFSDWSPQKIYDKTGITERRISAEDETAGDLAILAANKLFNDHKIDRKTIDFLLFCTQTPDHLLPATACILQKTLDLNDGIGAIDYNGGCSGFVYGVALAKGIIESGLANRVLLLTADTYTKIINDRDRSVCTLFGDGAAATLIEGEAHQRASIGPVVFGTDGSGSNNLIVPAGRFREPCSNQTAIEDTDRSGNIRSKNNLYMDGPAIVAFALKRVPQAYNRILELSEMSLNEIDLVVMHQANSYMLEKLRKKLDIPEEKFVSNLSLVGNTVSSSIPIALERHVSKSTRSRRNVVVIGFGVGYSWAAALIKI
ncbi:ketoacyl-ACP synthase III [Methylobacterium sp. A49B]